MKKISCGIRKILSYFKKINDLETLEEKSFWITAPMIALLGLAGLGTAGFYGSSLPTIISAVLCLVIPILLMIFVYKKQNYHNAYPLLCIFIGGLSIPFTFVFSGGFLSGMPLFCVVTTTITALCYDKRWRYFSFFTCLSGNLLAFIYVYFWGTPFPLVEDTGVDYSTVYNDVLFGYFAATVGMFTTISFITADVRKYKLSRDALQEFFDGEVRKEIIKKAMSGGEASNNEQRKAVILFADISNFTPITEKMNPELITSFLNEFFTTAGKCIHKTGGIIDKYIGDCIMAYWFSEEDKNCVFSAVQAMMELRMEIYSKEEVIYQKYGTELNFSVGISYGDVICGDIGSDTLHDYTVIGDAVNIASRLQSFAVGGEILISSEAADWVRDLVKLEQTDLNHFFKGKNKAIDVYRIAGFSLSNTEQVLVKSPNYGYTLHVCGCRGSFPVSGLRFSEYGGETSCYVIRKNDYALIIDCGTGLKNAVDILQDCKKIDVLLTHVHYDHILGLLMAKFPQNSNIHVYGNFVAWKDHTNTLDDFMQHPYWPIEMVNMEKVEVTPEKPILLDESITATFYNSNHPDDACVIEILLQDKKVVFLADCEDATILNPEISQNSELLFFDGMFDDNDQVSHKGWGHGTWQDGVRFYKSNNIKKMVITHHNPEIGDHSLMLRENEARTMEPSISFAKSGDIFEL